MRRPVIDGETRFKTSEHPNGLVEVGYLISDSEV
jgi:hypothetical protein